MFSLGRTYGRLASAAPLQELPDHLMCRISAAQQIALRKSASDWGSACSTSRNTNPFPAVSSIGHAASHGCVRMRNDDAVELAQLIMQRSRLALSRALIDTLTKAWQQTREFKLASYIPVSIIYRTAVVRYSMLTLFPDVFRRHPRGVYPEAMVALAQAGVDTIAVDRALVRRLSRNAVSQAASVPIHQLTAIAVEGGYPQ